MSSTRVHPSLAPFLGAAAFIITSVFAFAQETAFIPPAIAFEPEHIRQTMRLVRDWQLAHQQPSYWDRTSDNWRPYPDNSWVRAAFYVGVSVASEVTGEKEYFDAAKAWGERNAWKPGERPRHADDLCCGQTYLTVYKQTKDSAEIEPIKQRLDAIVADPKRGPVVGWATNQNWSWCDALFMAPATFSELSQVTGDIRYLDTMNVLWQDTQAHLYSKEYGLFYRDAAYKPDAKRPVLSPHKKPVFWSRGNGWVVAGLSRVLETMPADYHDRPKYVALLQEMSANIMKYQGADGFWPINLVDPEQTPGPETSGTGFFCYAFAWGVNHGVLDKQKFLPVIRNAWLALMSSVDAVGEVHWVQPIGAAPAGTQWFDTQEYGAGAFILASTEILKLTHDLEGLKKPIPVQPR